MVRIDPRDIPQLVGGVYGGRSVLCWPGDELWFVDESEVHRYRRVDRDWQYEFSVELVGVEPGGPWRVYGGRCDGAKWGAAETGQATAAGRSIYYFGGDRWQLVGYWRDPATDLL